MRGITAICRCRITGKVHRQMTLRVIALAASKGGCSKSTLATALAVQAVKEGGKVALLDWEPQGSVTLWWVMRQKPANPKLIRDAGDPVEAIPELGDDFDWALVDTPPSGMDEIARAIEAADFVLVSYVDGPLLARGWRRCIGSACDARRTGRARPPASGRPAARRSSPARSACAAGSWLRTPHRRRPRRSCCVGYRASPTDPAAAPPRTPAPRSGAPSDAQHRTPPSPPGSAAASRRTPAPGCAAASCAAPGARPHRPRATEKHSWMCPFQCA